MRLLVVMPGLTHDAGAERSFLAMAPALVREGLEVHVALLTDRQGPVPDLRALGMVTHDLSGARSLPARARAIRRLVRSVRPDVVHASLFEATVPSQLAVVGTGVPVVVSWTGTSYSPERYAEVASAWKLRMIQAMDGFVGRISRTRYHAVTEGVGRVNAAALRVPRERVMVGERGRDAEKYAVTPDSVAETLASLGLDAGTPVVLALGRQDVVKGYDSLLEAFDRVAAHLPTAQLLIGGRDGSATPALQRQLAGLAHGERVRFLGQRDDVPELLHLASVVVCSSTREGAAGSLIEAMACATPIVSVPLDGLEGVVVHEENALVVPRPDLGDAIERVLSDPDLAARLGAGGRATYEQRFTVRRAADRMVEIYEAATR